jgi:hypothetical protein
MVMNNKKRLGLSLSVLLVILLGVFFVLPQLIFSDGQKIKVTVEKPPELDKYITKHEPPKQEIKQVFEYKWDLPVDSCDGWDSYLWQIKFDPLPQVNKPSNIYVKLKSCWEMKTSGVGSHPIYNEGPLFRVSSDENALDYTPFVEPRWLYPIKKGEIYDGTIAIVPREIGKYRLHIIGGRFETFLNFGFNEKGELVHLSDRGIFPKNDLPNHPAITENEIYVKFGGTYVTNLFHITPPLSLNDTSTVYYRVITKDYYPDGMKIVTRDVKISFKMLPGPITKGDTLEGSFKVVPSRSGANGFALDIEEPPREGVKPKNDRFIARYHLDKDGKLLYIVKTQKESKIFYEYFKKKGVTVGEY